MSAKDELKKIKKNRKSLADQVRDLFQEGTKEIFDKYPELRSFGWNQYTPSFCDGDPCHFHVGEEIIVNGYSGEDRYPEWDEDENGDSTEIEEKKLNKIIGEIDDLRGEVDYSLLEGMFGDNVVITVTRDGISTDDYDCGY